jgi:pimeloyl-ACP methyl ester carboxylesterase
LTSTPSEVTFKEKPVWFGPADHPLLGWLTTPTGIAARGGVLLAPPIGREGRATRFAFRRLAAKLSELGFVTLRFDYHGVGDSAGSFDDPDLDRLWVESVTAAADLLRSCGLSSISLVGMRLGATIASVAAVEDHLDLSMLVLWDPCESGRAYLRELQALEALRLDNHLIDQGGSIETSEFVISADRAEEIRRLSLVKLAPGRVADRVLIVTRADRAVSEHFRERFDGENAEWKVSTDQAALINAEPLYAKMPETTMSEIEAWLNESPVASYPYTVPKDLTSAAVIQRSDTALDVQERCVEIGTNRLFGVIAEPVGEVRGPLVVFMNVSNEDHTGPSRMWVDLSRRWAALGLRCVRFDLSGLGDSPLVWSRNIELAYEGQWLEDIVSVAPTLIPESSSNAVYVGMCSGAFYSVEAALTLGARGVCAINPPGGIDYLRQVSRLRASHLRVVSSLGDRLNWAVLHLSIVVALTWQVSQSILPRRFVVDRLAEVVDSGIDLRVLASGHELRRHGRLAWLRFFLHKRLTAPTNYAVDVVPDLDHSLFSLKGRVEVVARLDRQLLEYLSSDHDPTLKLTGEAASQESRQEG